MAKVKMEDPRTLPKQGRFSFQSQKVKRKSAQKDADPLPSSAHNTDYVPPKTRPFAAGAHASKPAEEDVPLKERIAIAVLTVNGQETPIPIYEPLAGFEHLFTSEAACANPPGVPGHQRTEARPNGLVRSTFASTESDVSQISQSRSNKTSAEPRSLKRNRLKRRSAGRNRQDGRGFECIDETDSVAKTISSSTTYIGDFKGLQEFYYTRFKELTMKPLRKIVTEWVRELEPHRLRKFGPYHNELPSKAGDDRQPFWWPREIPYTEPSHLQLKDLIPLAVDLMLMHRKIDEESGKRRKPWIAELRRRASHCVDTTPTDSFSSSKGDAFNEKMKSRARDFVLPTLFDIAQSHEDYLAMHDLYEGYDNKDPGSGKYVTWERAPRPDRTQPNKRQRRSKNIPAPRASPIVEDSGEETEMDEHMGSQNSCNSSFQSQNSHCDDDDDVKVTPEAGHDRAHVQSMQESTPDLSNLGVAHSHSAVSTPTSIATPHTVFDQSMGRFCLGDNPSGGKVESNYGAIHFNGARPGYGPFGFQPMDAMTGISGPVPYHFTPVQCPNFFGDHASGIPASLPGTVSAPYPYPPQPPPAFGHLELPYGGYGFEGVQTTMTPIPPDASMMDTEDIRNRLPLGFPHN